MTQEQGSTNEQKIQDSTEIAEKEQNNGKKKKYKGIIWTVVIIAVAVIAGIILYSSLQSGDNFKRLYLDEYVKLEVKKAALKPGSAVYIDMSTGMNLAYSSTETKNALKDILDEFAGENSDKSTKFYELSENKISSVETMDANDLFNYVLNTVNTDKEEAPITEALKQIVTTGQPAILISDFEENTNGSIQMASYAKDFFETWLSQGNFITFYKWGYMEQDRQKSLFVAVFDGGYGEFAAKVESALGQSQSFSMEKFVLGGPEFIYPMAMSYENATRGGNYHDKEKDGKDVVSGVLEDGSAEAYKNYALTEEAAEALKSEEGMTPVDHKNGIMAQYYPVSAQWTDIVKNVEQMKEPEGDEIAFTHFIGKLFVDFTAQDGFKIEGIEARVYDMKEELKKFSDKYEAAAKSKGGKIDFLMGATPEITEMFTASISEDTIVNPLDGRKYNEIFLDFNDNFTGSNYHSSTEVGSYDLLKVNVVISKFSPDLERAREFFSWDGNESLSQSVVTVLNSAKASPEGTVLMAYYLKCREEKQK